MSETTTVAPPTNADDLSATGGTTAFSYCCECGTYDAHTTTCTCCGFDFRVAVSTEPAEP